MPQSKRPRKANFLDSEVRLLLEEIALEHDILFKSNNLSVTNKQKNEIWACITMKINACGTVVRTTNEIRDKWKSMKGAALNRQRSQSKPGGGPPEVPGPYEDIILSILGKSSNFYTGIIGNYTCITYIFVICLCNLNVYSCIPIAK